MRKTARILLTWALLSFGLATGAQDFGYRIVINSANPTSELPRSTVSKMFLKKASRWSDWDKTTVVAIDQGEKSDVRDLFSKEVHKKSVSAIKSYWQRMIFSGRDVPPQEFGSDEEVLEFVRGEPGAIGYISSGIELGDGVKELNVTE